MEDGKELLGATFSVCMPPVINLGPELNLLEGAMGQAIGEIVETAVQNIPPNNNDNKMHKVINENNGAKEDDLHSLNPYKKKVEPLIFYDLD